MITMSTCIVIAVIAALTAAARFHAGIHAKFAKHRSQPTRPVLILPVQEAPRQPRWF
jgi:hypothetical protein